MRAERKDKLLPVVESFTEAVACKGGKGICTETRLRPRQEAEGGASFHIQWGSVNKGRHMRGREMGWVRAGEHTSAPTPTPTPAARPAVISCALQTARWAAGRRGSTPSSSGASAGNLDSKSQREGAPPKTTRPKRHQCLNPQSSQRASRPASLNRVSEGSCENVNCPSSCSQSLQKQASPTTTCKSRGHCHLVAQKPRHQESWEGPCAPEGPQSWKWRGLNFIMKPK